MFNEIIRDIRMSYAFLYAADQLSFHSLGIRIYEVQSQKNNYSESHKERIVSEHSMLLNAIRYAQQSVSYARFAKGIWSENETILSLIIETLEAYVEYLQCQFDENSLWSLIEAKNEQLLKKKHGELFEKSGVIAEKIRLLLVSIFDSIEQGDEIEAFSHGRKITFRIRSMLGKQVGHDQVYNRTTSHANHTEKAYPSMPMSCL